MRYAPACSLREEHAGRREQQRHAHQSGGQLKRQREQPHAPADHHAATCDQQRNAAQSRARPPQPGQAGVGPESVGHQFVVGAGEEPSADDKDNGP